MANDWKTYRLADLCEFVNGFVFKSTDYIPPSADTFEVFRMGYINRGGGFKEDASPVFVPRRYTKNLDKFLLRPGDITIAMTDMKDRVAILGNTAWISHANRFVMNQRVGCIRAKRPDLVDPRFLYFYSNWQPHVEHLRSRANHGVQVNLTTAAIKGAEITVPSVDEQREIARVLGALDDKIELNRRMNRTLEELATTLFRSWFVDFNPVVAKAAGRKPAHLRPELVSLFPAHFQESELGPIPQGWDIKTVEDLARYVNGRAFTKGASGKGRMVIRIAELNSGPGGSTVYSDIDVAPEHLARPGDLLFAWSGSLDVYRWYRDEAIINQHIFKVTCEKYPQWFVHEQLREAMPFFQDIAADKATTMGHIKKEHLSQALVVVPPNELLDAADRTFQPLYEKQLANERESLTLAALRDTLLPKLLSGELRVKRAEKLLAAAS